MSLEKARRLNAVIVEARKLVGDQTASIASELYDRMKYDSRLIQAGTRINWKGVIKKAAVDLWDTAENNPDNAPTLWESIDYRDGIRIIPEVITVTTAFDLNELGRWGDVLYRSLVSVNVYTPEAYPNNWQIVE